MAVRGRKSVSATWYTCDSCHVVLNHKDLIVHQEKFCPPTPNSCNHAFISDKVLYSFLEEFTSTDDLRYLPKSEHRHLVFLSVTTMQLCDLAIGDPVLVDSAGVSVVMTAWPTNDKSPLTVRMLSDSIKLNWQHGAGLVKIHGLQGLPLVASEVVVNSRTGHSNVPSHATSLLHTHYINKILSVGCRLCVPNYGHTLYFQVQQLLPFCEDASSEVGSVTEQLSRLRCAGEDKSINSTLCKVVATTRWRMLDCDTPPEVVRENKLQSVGGLHTVVLRLQELIKLCLGTQSGAELMGVKMSCGVLLYGPSGAGKTLVAEAVATDSKAFVVRVRAPEVFSKFLGETEAKLRQQFEMAREHAPSIVLLDEIECLCPSRGGTEQERRVAAALLALVDELTHRTERVMVLATTCRLDDVHPALRRPGRLEEEIEVGVPGPNDRLDILHKLLQHVPHQLNTHDLEMLAASTHGFVGADLASLCARAARQSLRTAQQYITGKDFVDALVAVKPSAMREVLVQIPDVKWSDIAGQHELKLKLRQAVEWPLKHSHAFSRLGISPPRGLLMFGPPGCSKTMIAKALATESRLNFLSIKGPELFSKWVGESERAVREVFRRARQVAPAIVFFDELDAIGGERSSGQSQGSNVQERVLAQLLTEMDGVESLGNVMVVGATNRPDRIDKALLRPGRLDRVVYVPLPDANTRREIIHLQLCHTPVSDDVDVEELVCHTHGYSGAEVLAVCNEAALKALEEDMSACMVQHTHFQAALSTISPRTSPALLQLYLDYQAAASPLSGTTI